MSLATDGIRHRHVLEHQLFNDCDFCAVEVSVWKEVAEVATRMANDANTEVVRFPADSPKRNFYLGMRQVADDFTNLAADRAKGARERRLW